MKIIIFVDKETGGLKPETADITQIAAILDIDGEEKETLNLFLRPDPKRVNPEALAIQKKTLDEVLSHPLSQKEGYEAFKATLERWTNNGAVKASWGGHNATFDVSFANALFATNGDKGGLSRYFDGSTVDTRFLADNLRGQRKLASFNSKLSTVCDTLGVPLGVGAHDALNDIRATRYCYYKMKEKYLTPAKAA